MLLQRLFRPLLPILASTSKQESSSGEDDESSLSLVQWRWARARGFYSSETRQWNEAKGGLKGYLKDVQRRRIKKRLLATEKLKKPSTDPKFALDGRPRPPHCASKTSTQPRHVLKPVQTQKCPAALCERVVMGMNLEGLEPLDLFSSTLCWPVSDWEGRGGCGSFERE
jgi:hypothetical protein